MPISKNCVPTDIMKPLGTSSPIRAVALSRNCFTIHHHTVADKPKVNTSAVMQNAVRRLAEIFQNVRTIQKNTIKERWARPVASGQDSR